MIQVIQNIRSGEVSLSRAPDPIARPGSVLIANVASLISAGTEKMIMDLAKKSLIGKARQRPDQVKRVLEKIKNEGFFTTIKQVMEKLDEPMNMGYSSAGVVLECGAGVQCYKPGDRVSSNGPHAGIVSVARHLTAPIPDNVPFDHAAFAVIGAIALQGTRLAKVNLGETVLVVGLGLVGQLAVGLLRASGCRVIGTDLDPSKCELALKMGAQIARPGIRAADVEALTGGLGADAVVITASTDSNGPIELAAGAVRQKGRIVLVGVVGLQLDRRPFYFKEAEFVVSCSYGPGRYDPNYEERGNDYPAAHVRWTEQRNMQAVLQLMGSGHLNVAPLISHRFPIDRGLEGYELIETRKEPYVGIVLEYPEVAPNQINRRIDFRPTPATAGKIGVGVLGAGNFARMVLLPAMQKSPRLHPVVLCSAGGSSAAHTGEKLGFDSVAADEDLVFADKNVNVVFSITRPDIRARHVIKALKAGQHVFAEKPLCLTVEELEQIEQAVTESNGGRMLMVGYNRRFSEAAVRVRKFFSGVDSPLTVSIRFNAGPIPADNWVQADAAGGGRIINEACHAIDLAVFLTGSLPVRVYAESVGGPGAPAITDDQCFITLRHANGAISNIAYISSGDKAFPKERVEVIGGGRVAVIDDFKSITTCAKGKMSTDKQWQQDKGFNSEIEVFTQALVSGGPSPIPWPQLRATSLAAILAVRSLREGMPFEVG